MPMLQAWSYHKPVATVANGTAAYSAQDVCGGLITFTGAGKNKEREIAHGYIADIWVSEVGVVGAAFDVYLFNKAPTAIADNGALTLSAAELDNAFAKESISTYNTVLKTGGGTIKWAHANSLVHEFAPGDGNIYAFLVPTATPTFSAASVLKLALGVWTG